MIEEQAEVFLGLGSNLGDGKNTLLQAWDALAEQPGIVCEKLSSPYLTAPVDMTSHHWFTNAVGQLTVTITPLQLLDRMMAVEAYFGRKRDREQFGHQDRTLDLDLIYFGQLEIHLPALIVPHPRRVDRLFVLAPLVELAPDFTDPVKRKSTVQMRDELLTFLETASHKKQEIIKDSWL